MTKKFGHCYKKFSDILKGDFGNTLANMLSTLDLNFISITKILTHIVNLSE